MKNWASFFIVVLLLNSCKSDLNEEEMEWEEPSNELSESVAGEDLLRYYSKNINSSHNNTVLILYEDSARILGKDMDSLLALKDSTLLELYWETNDWLRSQKINHNGEEKYYVKMSDLMPNNQDIKEHFPNDYHLLNKMRPSEGFKLARERTSFNFFYQMSDSVFYQTMNNVERFSKEEFTYYFDSLIVKW